MKLSGPLSVAIIAMLPAFAGCSIFVATNGDINDGSVERTTAKDNEARLDRMRDSGSLSPVEYQTLQNKTVGGSSADSIPKPTMDDLDRRIEESRRNSEGVAP